MKLFDFSEKSFIKNVLGKYADTAKSERFDDCVVIDLAMFTKDPNAPFLVYSMDHPSFIKRNILSKEESYRFYGRWAAACTCGDVLAMGALPKGFSLDLAAPLETDIIDIENIMHGIGDTLRHYGIVFEGGNFDTNHLETVCMAWGVVERNRIIRRSGARVGDLIVATGTLGIGWSGYISQKLDLYHRLKNETRREIDHYKIFPVAPIKAMLEAFETGGITSGMDLSDGLVEFFYTISERNHVGVEVTQAALPITDQMQEVAGILGIDGRLFCLEPGYDTPLTHGWTVNPDHWSSIKEIFDRYEVPIHVYGIVTESQGVWLKKEDQSFVSIPEFWDDQFKKGNTVERWLTFVKQLSSEGYYA